MSTPSDLKEILAVKLLHMKLAAGQAPLQAFVKQAAGAALGPSQDLQSVTGQNVAPSPAPAPKKTLQELMGTPDIQKWFRGSVRGLANRGSVPYALLSPEQEVQTNMEKAQLKAILQQLLAKG